MRRQALLVPIVQEPPFGVFDGQQLGWEKIPLNGATLTLIDESRLFGTWLLDFCLSP